jgi:hypothetical protein
VDIAAFGLQTFAISLTPTAALDQTEVSHGFVGEGLPQAMLISDVNTMLLSSAVVRVPNIVAWAAAADRAGRERRRDREDATSPGIECDGPSRCRENTERGRLGRYRSAWRRELD